MNILNISLDILILFSFNLANGAKAKAINKTNKNVKIVNGGEAIPHSMPYMAAIHTTIDDRSVRCGGSLITDSMVLTAARCVNGAEEVEVILGAHNLDEEEISQRTMRSSEFIIHREYTNNSLQHDIALIELPSPVPLNENITTIKLPEILDIFKSYDEDLGTIAGWGKVEDVANTTSSVLNFAKITIIPILTCEISYLFSLTGDQMCVSGVSKANICLGDAGGPLVVNGTQVGIASFGSDFGCSVGFPGVFTRITSYIGWIKINIDA